MKKLTPALATNSFPIKVQRDHIDVSRRGGEHPHLLTRPRHSEYHDSVSGMQVQKPDWAIDDEDGT
jgi:hypothetical protein